MSSKQPDWRLTVAKRYNPNDDERPRSVRIGAAWNIEKDGHVIGVNLRIDDGVPPLLLTSAYDLTLWRNDDKPRGSRPAEKPPADDVGDDEIPF